MASNRTPRKQAAAAAQNASEPSRAVSGAPEPQKVAAALAPEVTIGPTPRGEREDNPDATAANGVDAERNGAPSQVGSARGEEPPAADGENAPRTAAHPVVEQDPDNADTLRSGLALNMRENDTVRGDKPGEGILLNGARSEKGTGTDTPEDADATKDLPEYPSSTLVRKTPRSAPLEPADVRHAVKPELGHDLASTDASAAAAGLRSMAGENQTRLLDGDGKEVASGDIFESLESNPYVRVVKQDVVEEFTVHRQKTPLTRLLFVKGQQVPAAIAEQFVALHG